MTVTTELRFNGSRSERLPFPVFPTQPFNKSRMSSSRRAPAYSCSSSCSSSPTDSPFGDAARRAAGLTAMGDRRQSFSERRRLTRQRKLRHATDDELGLSLSRSTPVSPESTPKSRSPPGGVNRRWSTAVPQPLPLPELVSGRAAGPSNFRSPPAEGPTSELVGHHISNGNSICKPSAKTNDHSALKAAKPATYFRRGFSQNLNLDRHHLRPNTPARSAPSSPVLSPPRSSAPASQAWLTLEPGRNTQSADHSPLHSPTSGQNFNYQKNPRSVTFPLHHHKSTSDSPSSWFENNLNAHPLPLPPGPQLISQQSPAYNKSNMSCSRCQWQKGKLIGRGTFGSVYVATNTETGALCAMKQVDLVPDDPKCAESIKQLEQEIKVLRQLKHPNIVQYYGSEITDDHFYIYLEYVYPGSINNYVQYHCGAMNESVVRNFTRHILSGLAYLHSTNTVHRDIKGANLLVDAMGVVKLADFGMAKHLTGQVSVLSLKGSPYWMAPELLLGTLTGDTKPEIAFAVDIWSVGCTIIEMLDGKPPWSDLEGPQAMFKVLNRSPPIPKNLSAQGKDFLQCCFRRNPAERPSAVELLQHPFLRNSHDQHIHFPGLRFVGKSSHPRDSSKHKFKLISILS
ncbi:mitogen-activated protein kinase kinase kinase 5-like isoform X2 [Punica granatum]|uniref:mitogen-activated protein kinase kinase kinase n=1 Tax=Punica granatum TaxID=22663 RepID=A0A6P8BVM4_PUNGR|nr:mitogen-activated protein kinase kinase kinase 5-like isoform X2 [Punica granatum]